MYKKINIFLFIQDQRLSREKVVPSMTGEKERSLRSEGTVSLVALKKVCVKKLAQCEIIFYYIQQ